MEIKSYQNQAELLVKEYLLADSVIPYTSVICGICACKMVYDLTQLFSNVYFKSYPGLSKLQRTEWSNRSISTFHAIFITIMSLYFVFWSNLYSDHEYAGPITFRSSALSTFTLGVFDDIKKLICLAFSVKVSHQNEYHHDVSDPINVQSQPVSLIFHGCVLNHLAVGIKEKILQISLGYFLSDLAMIIWFYPFLGGMEYVLHHLLSVAGIANPMLTGEGQVYTFMVLISESTTPGINLRWYLDTAGMKRSRAYLINGVVMFVAWLVARILLFMYLFYHIYLHYDQPTAIFSSNQVKQVNSLGQLLISIVPLVLSVMNLMWFGKIIKGLMKTLAKRH
ncbi:hypothetical protein GOBAR_AA20523 [Gossypium barbadense]|uniref:TLC domain-containing protein n=1 Tax=Gossypium barbadense TaxID=3634 RepID=A0A2P5X9X7_GOSBA|nr:hypothetical protein GOBAR_AA20523 [Gossypium barbadense]